MDRTIKNLTGVCCLTALLGACAGTGEKSNPNVELAFLLNVGTAPAACGRTYRDVGSTTASMSLQDARLYVSNIRLIDADGSETAFALEQDGVWQSGNVALLDFEDATGACNGNPVTNTTVRGTMPGGSFTGIAFDVGVPENMNHQDPTLAAAPLNLSALSWPWRNGYKYTTIDLETAIQSGSAEGAPGFSVHIGATECGDSTPVRPPAVACRQQNRPSVRLESFNPIDQVIVIDLAELLAETDLTTNQPGTPSGCMSGGNDADCDGIFQRAGLRGPEQRFVRAENRTAALASND